MKGKNQTVAVLIPQESIEDKIFLIRGKRVMLDKEIKTWRNYME